MTASMSSSLLLACCSLLATVVVIGAGEASESAKCIQASKAACVWVSKPRDHNGIAHISNDCEEKGSRCVFSSTCHVYGVYRDVYTCQAKHGKNNVRSSKHRDVKASYDNKEAMMARAHARRRRSASHDDAQKRHSASDEDAPERRSESDDDTLQLGKSGSTKIVPDMFKRIMQRHRSYNAAAFNRGIYIINGMKYKQKESINVKPIRTGVKIDNTEDTTSAPN